MMKTTITDEKLIDAYNIIMIYSQMVGSVYIPSKDERIYPIPEELLDPINYKSKIDLLEILQGIAPAIYKDKDPTNALMKIMLLMTNGLINEKPNIENIQEQIYDFIENKYISLPHILIDKLPKNLRSPQEFIDEAKQKFPDIGKLINEERNQRVNKSVVEA